MEKLRRGRRARGTGPFQARLDGMGWPAMRTPLGGRREFRVAAFYAPARKLPVTFGRGAAPPRPREGRDGGGHRRRWTGRGSLVAPTPALPRERGRGPRAWRAVCPTPTLPRGRGRGTTIRKLRPLPPLAGEGWDGGRAAGALAASVAWLPPPGPPPRAGEGAKGVAGRVPHSNPPSRAGTGHHDPQAPAPSPACGGRLGWGPRRRRACCFRRLAAPTRPSPAGGGGGQGRGGPCAPLQPSLAGGDGAPRSASSGPFPRLRGKVGMGAAPQARLLLPSPVCPHPALPRGRGSGPRAWRAVCPTPTLPRGRGRGTTIRKLRPLPPLAGEGWDGGRAAGALAASVAWLPPPGPPPRAGEGGKGVAGRVPHSNPPSRAGTGHHDPQAPAPSPACGGRLGWGPRRRRACCFRRLSAPTRPSPAGGGGGQGRGGPCAPLQPSLAGGDGAPRSASSGPFPRLRGKVGMGAAPQARLLLPSPVCPH